MSEPDYRDWLKALEGDPLFARLRSWNGRAVIRREPRPGARFAWPESALGGKDVAGPSGLGALSDLDEETAGLVRKLGLEAFERAFLRGEETAQRRAAAAAAGLTEAEGERVARLVDSLAFFENEKNINGTTERFALGRPHCIASIERTPEGYAVAYVSTHYLRGRYRVDYAALSGLKSSLPRAEWARVRELVRQLELANRKLSALGRILEALPSLQPAFLSAGDPESLVPLRQNAVARELGLSPSAICRALAGRSVRVPRGREVALSAFFPSTRARTERLIALVAGGRPDATDEQIRGELEARHGLSVTRRLVNLRRRALREAA